MVRHYNTWIKEGKNWWIYKHYQNSLHRLAAAGYNSFGGQETFLYSKKDVLEYVKDRINDLEFVYTSENMRLGNYGIYAKKLGEIIAP